MSRRHESPKSVRPERTLTRSGLWATGPVQLQLPFEATGLSERIQASGRLSLTPDYDVFAWLCERWQNRPTETGWMRPSLYEIGSALYDRPPSNEDYKTLRASLDRLADVTVTIDGYDIEHGEFRDRWVSRTHLVELSQPYVDRQAGEDRQGIRLGEWLRLALADEQLVRLHWRTLRAFDARQALAKRLWIYMSAEKWKRTTATSEGTWVAVGDRLFAALGMNHAEHRHSRRALKAACLTVRKVDPRYGAGELEVVRRGSKWQLVGERPTWDAWQHQRAEQAVARAEIQKALAGPLQRTT